jgi:predicted  nucleic acid-binding Zn-ribbon protein
MNTPRLLFSLQEIDQELESARETIARLKASQGQTEELAQARVQSAAAEQRLKDGKKQQAELEFQVGHIAERLAQSQEHLYSGVVRHPKELQDLQDEVTSLTRRYAALQDELLNAMVEAEEVKEASDQARAHLSRTENQWESAQKQAEVELGRLALRSAELARQREDLELLLKPADLALYVDLRRRKGTHPIAPLKRQACSACGVTLPVSTARQARNADELVFCPSCGRLLFAP